MACQTIKKVTFDLCEPSMGGITKLYLANIDDVSAVTISTATTFEASAEGITTITMNTDKHFEEFTVKKNTSNLTSTLTVNDNGSSYVSSVISYVMPRMDSAKRAAMQALIMSEAVAIVKDANGKYWFIGDVTNSAPLTNTAGTGETGTAKGDSNQYTVELTAETTMWPYEVDGTIIAGLLSQ